MNQRGTAEVWLKLAAPIPPDIIQWRQDGKPTVRDGKYFARFVAFVDAIFVRQRLDDVAAGEWDLTLELLPMQLGPSDDGERLCSFKARLGVFGVIREDVGLGSDYKVASTDAFKRAAVRFGIANELYAYEQNWVEVDGDSKYARPIENPAIAYQRRYGGAVSTATSLDRETGANAAAPPASTLTDTTIVSCPKCGGRMWDNRLTKRNPRAPDYKCQNRSCDGVVWPPREVAEAKPELIGGTEELPF